jgi:hypothetical protein
MSDLGVIWGAVGEPIHNVGRGCRASMPRTCDWIGLFAGLMEEDHEQPNWIDVTMRNHDERLAQFQSFSDPPPPGRN